MRTDWAYLDSFVRGFYGEIVDRYFRARIVGADKLPAEGALIVAPNHSGNAFPHDAVVLDTLLWRHFGLTRRAKFRSVFTPQLAAVWWMRPFGLDDWWRRCAGVDMTVGNFDRLLASGERVIYYPEGVPGIGKGFLKRYQLQPYQASFVLLAARHDTPVYPVSSVNSEWVNPASITFPWLDRIIGRIARLPFAPVPAGILAMVFPFALYLAFPSRMVFVVGDALDVRRMLAEEGAADPTRPDRRAARRVAERIRQAAQAQLDASVKQHGRRPWDLVGLARSLWKVRGRILRTTPLGWPVAFLTHERNRHRAPARNRLHALLRDLDIAFYYLPFGWLGIALARRLRRPPYGYRGLSRKERVEREGTFHWKLGR